MYLYWMFVAEALVPHALFYGLWWRFAVRKAPAPAIAHLAAVALLCLQGAVWLYAANLGGPPTTGGPAWLLVTLIFPAGSSLAAAWLVRETVRLRTPDDTGQRPRPNPTILTLTILGAAVWGLALLFTAFVVAVALAQVREPKVAPTAARPAAPAPPPRSAALPPGYRLETPPAPAMSPEAAQAAAEQERSREALAWEARNPRFLADPARAQAMQQAIHEVEQASGGQIGARDLLTRAESVAFERTGWGEQLRLRERVCGDTFTMKLRALDGMDLGEFAARHERIVAEKDRCYQAAR